MLCRNKKITNMLINITLSIKISLRLIFNQIRILSAVLIICFISSCNSEEFRVEANTSLRFSSDTISFDTIFTTIGSSVLPLKVYNPYNEYIRISSISLAGGNNSFFRINIDGEPGYLANNIQLPPKDSLYIFIALTIDPQNSNNPVLINDSIVFNVNGLVQDVKLIAYGQDVNKLQESTINSQTWSNEKPYLIFGDITLAEGETLIIEKGANIHFHKNAGLIIKGRLISSGTHEEPVNMKHDRTEKFYENIPGQWNSIYFEPSSTGNILSHTFISNAITGIQSGKADSGNKPQIEIRNSIIQNCSFAGIYAINSELLCYNTLVINSAGPSVALLKGGDYTFLHCTIMNTGVIGTSRSSPALKISNFLYHPVKDPISGQETFILFTGDLSRAFFANSIIYGSLFNEVILDDNKQNLFEYSFSHSLIKVNSEAVEVTETEHYNMNIFNKDPKFVNDSVRNEMNLKLQLTSPAINAGDTSLLNDFPFLEKDLENNLRTNDMLPDLDGQ